MGNLKISEDLFLEKQELNRFKRFLEDEGFKQEFLFNTTTFGIVKGYNLPNGLHIDAAYSYLVENVGSGTHLVNIRTGRAVDKYANILTLDSSYSLTIPNTGLWYWIKIKFRKVNYELGTVNVDINGNLTGSGTFFTEVLRGQPNFTTKIKFVNSSLNIGEYDVVDVVNDTTVILSGDFLAETGLKYGVVGTFTPGFVPATIDKMIYEYDDVLISVVAEDPLAPNVPPAKIAGEEFYLARVRTAGLNVEIQDKRLEIWQTRAEYEIHLIDRQPNTIIGVESVKWDINTQPRTLNEVNIAWGFRSTNWSLDTTQNLFTIDSGIGGILKQNDVTYFVNGMFDGWRLYAKSGKYSRIISSTKTGTQLNIRVDYVDYDEFLSPTDEIHIVPDVEEICIRARWNDPKEYNRIIEEEFIFPIHLSCGKLYVRIMDPVDEYLYNFTYRYKTFREFTDYTVLPNDTIGYYAEHSFLDNGDLKPDPADRELKPYAGHISQGFIAIIPHPNNWNILFQSILTGDLFGLDHKYMTNATPLIDLVVGQDRQHQVLHFTALTLANDIFINLNKVRSDGTPCINGNRFIVQLEGSLVLNSRNLRIVTDYVNPTTYTLVRNIEQIDVNFILQNQRLQRSGLVLMFTYDGTDWWLSISNEMNGVPLGTIVAYSGNPASDFDNTGLGIAPNVIGWALCNGVVQAGINTKNLKGRVIVGYDPLDPDYWYPGTGGSKYRSITVNNLPLHHHRVDWITPQKGSHAHQLIPCIYGTGSGGGDHQQLDYDGDSGPVYVEWTDQGGAHTHHIDCDTSDAGGVASPADVDVRQPFLTLMYIQKII